MALLTKRTSGPCHPVSLHPLILLPLTHYVMASLITQERVSCWLHSAQHITREYSPRAARCHPLRRAQRARTGAHATTRQPIALCPRVPTFSGKRERALSSVFLTCRISSTWIALPRGVQVKFELSGWEMGPTSPVHLQTAHAEPGGTSKECDFAVHTTPSAYHDV